MKIERILPVPQPVMYKIELTQEELDFLYCLSYFATVDGTVNPHRLCDTFKGGGARIAYHKIGIGSFDMKERQ